MLYHKKARVFVTSIHFHPSLIFVGNARSLPLEWSSIRGSTLVGSSLACKYKTRVEVNVCGKHSSLLQYVNIYSRKIFYCLGPGIIKNPTKYCHTFITYVPHPEANSIKPFSFVDTKATSNLCSSLMFAGKARSLP
jgi:hypothetical protein